MLLLLYLTCNIFIILWILRFCMLISIIIIFWFDWLIMFLITYLIMIMKQVLITQIFAFRVVIQLIFFIIWFFASIKFSMSIISLLESFLAIIIFFLLLFLIFVFTVFIIFTDLISSLLKNEYLYYRIMILCSICLSTALIIEFSLIFIILI